MESPGRTRRPAGGHSLAGRAFSRMLNILHNVGIWPLGKSRSYSSCTFAVCASYFAYLLMTIWFFAAGGKSTASYLEQAGISLALIPVTVNVVLILRERSRLEDVIADLRSFFARASCGLAEGPLNKALAEEKILVTVLSLICTFGGSAKVVEPLVTYCESRQDANSTAAVNLPLRLFTTEEATIPAFAAMFAFQSLVYFVIFLTFVPAEVFLCVLILYTATQFEVINVLLRNVDRPARLPGLEVWDGSLHFRSLGGPQDASPTKDRKMCPVPENTGSRHETPSANTKNHLDLAKNRTMETFWRKLVVHHQEALRNAVTLCELLRLVLFLNYAVTSLVICLILYQLNAKMLLLLVTSIRDVYIYRDTNAQAVFPIVYNCNYLAAVSLRLFVFSFLSTRLTSQSLAVSEAVGATGWYDYTPGTKTTLVIIMCRARRPVQMWAGRFAVMSLETYTAILHTAYSYFNVLNRVT